MNKLILLLVLLGLSGCGSRYDIAETMARSHPEYYPELSVKQRALLIWDNITDGYDPLAKNKVPKPQVHNNNYNTTNCHH